VFQYWIFSYLVFKVFCFTYQIVVYSSKLFTAALHLANYCCEVKTSELQFFVETKQQLLYIGCFSTVSVLAFIKISYFKANDKQLLVWKVWVRKMNSWFWSLVKVLWNFTPMAKDTYQVSPLFFKKNWVKIKKIIEMWCLINYFM